MNNFINQNKNKIKILSILVSAFVVSSVLSNTVFLAKTPRINTVFLTKVVNFPGTLINNSKEFIASLFSGQKNGTNSVATQQAIKQLQNVPLNAMTRISEGVYAAEDKQARVIYIKTAPNLQWEERTMTVDGKQMKVRFPKGTFK